MNNKDRTRMKTKCILPVPLPEIGKPVKAVIKLVLPNTIGWDVIIDSLIAVNEPNCNWKFEDGSELPYLADVIYWEYKKE